MIPRRLKRALSILSIVVVGACGLLLAASRLAQPPKRLGIRDGRLAPCPDSPNCVSSMAEDPRQRMEPIPFAGSADQAMQGLRQAMEEYPRSRVIQSTERYLHAECRSPIFRFADDVEFMIDPDRQVIHFRSASRTGYSDLGVNRRRMEQIRDRFAAGSRSSGHSQ